MLDEPKGCAMRRMLMPDLGYQDQGCSEKVRASVQDMDGLPKSCA